MSVTNSHSPFVRVRLRSELIDLNSFPVSARVKTTTMHNHLIVRLLFCCIIRDDKGQLLLGIRRANRQQTAMPSSVLTSDSMHIGVLAAANHAAATNSRFTIFYNPRYTCHF